MSTTDPRVRRPILRRVLRGLSVVAILLVLTLALSLFFPRAGVRVVRWVGIIPDSVEFQMERIRTLPPGSLLLVGAEIDWPGGSMSVDTVRARFSLGLRGLRLRSLLLHSPRLRLDPSPPGGGSGELELPELASESVTIRNGSVRGVRISSPNEGPTSWTLDGIELASSGLSLGGDPSWRLESLELRGQTSTLETPVTIRAESELGPEGLRLTASLSSRRSDLTLEGRGSWEKQISVLLRSLEGRVETDRLDLADLTPFVPWDLPEGFLAADLDVVGATGRAEGTVALDLDGGGGGFFQGRATLPQEGPVEVDVEADLRRLDPELLGLPGEGEISGEVRIDLGGSSWAELSGRARGRLASSSPELEGDVELTAEGGVLVASAAGEMFQRSLALAGSLSLADPHRPWEVTARIQGQGDSLNVRTRGRGAAGSADAAGKLLGSLLTGEGSFGGEDGARLELVLKEVPGPADSAHVFLRPGQPTAINGRVFGGSGTADLKARWADGRITLEDGRVALWPLGGDNWGAASGRGVGWVAVSSSGVQGRLSWSLQEIEDGRLDGVTGAGEVTLEGERADVSGVMERMGRDRGTLAGSVAWGSGGIRVRLQELAARWEAEESTRVNEVEWNGSLELSAVAWDGSGRASLRQSLEGVGVREVDLELTSLNGNLQVEGIGQGPEGYIQLSALALGGWEGAGEATLSATTDSLSLPASSSEPGASWFSGTATLQLPRWSRGLPGGSLRVRGGGTLNNLPVDSLRLDVSSLDAGDWKLDGALISDGLEGRGEATARMVEGRPELYWASLKGSATDPDAVARVSGGRVVARGEGNLELQRDAAASIVRGGASLFGLRGFGVSASVASLEVDGGWDEDGPEGDVVAELEAMRIGEAPPGNATLSLESRAGSLRVAGSWGEELGLDLIGSSSPDRIVFQSGGLRIGVDTMPLVHPGAFEVLPSGRRLQELAFRGSGIAPPFLSVSGSWPKAGPWTVQTEVADLPRDPIMTRIPYSLPSLRDTRFVGMGTLQGGTPEGVVGEATMALQGFFDSGEPLEMQLRALIDPAMVDIAVESRIQDRWAKAEVAYPLREGVEGLRMELEADDFPLSPFLDIPGTSFSIREARVDGTLLRVGSGEAPVLEGDLGLTVGSLDLARTDQSFQDVDLQLSGIGSFLGIVASARSGAGRARLEGGLSLPSDSASGLDLVLDADDFPVDWVSNASLRTTGQLRLTGSLSEPTVAGDVRLEGSELLLGNGMAVEAVELSDQDRTLLRERFGWEDRGPATSSVIPLEPLSADVTVELGGDVWIRRWADPELAVALTGSVGIQKDPGKPFQLFGTLSPISTVSSFRQFGRRFAVRSGSIELLGPVESVDFTLSGEHEVASRTDPGNPEAVITMTVQGSPRDLSVLLESDPSMDQADIVSYLILGQPSGDLSGQNRTLATEAGAGIALSRLSSVLGEAASEAVGLDVVDLEPRPLGGVTLVAGRYLSPRLFVAVRQPVAWQSQAGTQALGADRLPALEAELRAARWLLLNLEGDAEGFGFLLRSRWGY